MSTRESDTDIVKLFMNALETNEQEKAAGYLTDAAIISGWTPAPVNKQTFLAIISELKEGIPGLIFNLHNVLEEEAHCVTGTWQVSGYQSDSFEINQLGLPPIPQTAGSVSLPAEDVAFVLDDDGQIERISVDTVEDGGIHGLIRQLGIDAPIIQ